MFWLRNLRGRAGRECLLSVLLLDGVVLVDPEYLKERRGEVVGPTAGL